MSGSNQDIIDMLREMGLDGDEAQPGASDDFRGGRTASPDDIFIALMGVTGAGKSSFISCCCDDSAPVQTVYLIDTPGFDDSVRTDSQVLREIASWLSRSYTNKIFLHGIIYVHRISDRRMQGSALRNLLAFKRLCGDNGLKKVLLVTTMWDEVPRDEATVREEELVSKPEFWGRMIQKGSTTHRHTNTITSARDIITRIVNGRDGESGPKPPRQ
ncbi:hypothetical protein F5X68DRAFT_277541 [Plectosphaerella plurivora]|uniref:G domain-containing protein n=1 Tax=Plectosphaerella plurivora TaxID=936078 RepID=A0A9P9A831_9PEZI|nr:hypothetical protein F5X68DRAFT_277541 [Plectosphaerella plurivora]